MIKLEKLNQGAYKSFTYSNIYIFNNEVNAIIYFKIF